IGQNRLRRFWRTSASFPRAKHVGFARCSVPIACGDSSGRHFRFRVGAAGQGALPALQSTTKCARSLPVSFLASACLLQVLSEGCFSGVADGVAGGSAATAAAVTPQLSRAVAAKAVMIFMRSLLGCDA